MALNLSLRAKITLTVIVIGAVVGGVNLYQTREVGQVDSTTNQLIGEDLKRLDLLRQVQYENAQLLPVGRPANVVATSVVDLKPGFHDHALQMQKYADAYLARAEHDSGDVPDTKLLNEFTAATVDVTKLTASLNGKSTTTSATMDMLNQRSTRLDAATTSLVQQEQASISTQTAKIRTTMRQINGQFLWLTVGVTMAATLVGIIMMTSITRSLAKIRAGATRIANGDFSAPLTVDTNDELGQLGQSFNSMSERLKDSYRRLAVEQQRDEAILQGMGEGLIATDEKGKVLIVNHIGANYLRVADIKAAIGKPIQDIYQLYVADAKDNSEPLTGQARPVYAALATGEQVEGVFGFYQQDGKKALLNITATPIKLGGKVVGAISILRDVTKEREVDRMKTEFISLASHQLRTPLSAIKWFTEMLISGDAGELKPEQMEFAKNIDDSTTRMIALVNALLNISRIESGRIMIDPKPTDLRELVNGIVNDLKAKTEERQQTLIISVHDELPKINLDARLIGQVYLNLLTNAIKYTPKGGEVSVFISRKGDEIISQVTDNGYGIPKDQQGKVFQKFFRAANAVKVETDGTGLGLYLIKSVVESSGGKIWFESEEGKGTTFWFSIPLSGMKAKEGEVTLDV